MKNIRILSVLTVLAFFVFSCKKEPTPTPRPEPKDTIERTVIVYMNADNNLYDVNIGGVNYGALADINEMEQAWDDSFGGSLIVYLNPPLSKGKPTIYHIQHDDDPTTIKSPVLKTYDSQDANDTSVFSSVLNDIMELKPAKHCGLILWSHGTGWVPRDLGQPLRADRSASIVDGSGPVTYTFGYSGSHGKTEMEIDQLAKAIPDKLKFDYIAFDACYMGGIEVAYELRNSCRYFIGSAVETPIDGFEYQLITEDMMRANVQNIVRKTYEYYNSLYGWWATCAISVVDCSKIEDLAATVKSLVENSPRALSDIKFDNMQDLSSSYSFIGTYYDFGDFINQTWVGEAGLSAFNDKMAEVVIAKYNTKWNLDDYPIDRYSGFSCFAPKAYQTQAIAAFRARFTWSAASGIGTME